MFNYIVDACKMLKGVASSAQSQPLMQNCASLHAHARLPAYLFTSSFLTAKSSAFYSTLCYPQGLISFFVRIIQKVFSINGNSSFIESLKICYIKKVSHYCS